MHVPAARRTPAIEAEHVRAVYDTIATHWSSTRYKPWPRVAEYLHARCKSGHLIADLGCGNGKYLGCAPQGVVVVGCDASAALLSLCSKTPAGRAAELCTADVVLLPYRDGQFDAAISIAVLHHLSTRQRRLAAAAEMVRVLRPGGTVLVYAWAQEQGEESSRSFSHQDMLVPWHFADSMRRKSADASTERHGGAKTSQQPQHGYRAEGKHSTVFQRYCHLFKEGEVEALFHRVGGCTVVQSYYDCSNWCAVVQKDVADKHNIIE
ncbi:S-adenosyl-L-methionine-dependent methyltransferase [Tribonema minus]|uniref:S-adenosyl-L-methionine-dependent methyltransferase n=1 Tax=Tribonema minus TaxID=303371 RepID=A0A835YPN8_9STRA|nr:S-adenosyl-L-methionine-dependent methyltransferase [Tribonema minus]